MDKRRLSPDANRALLWVARAGIDNLYTPSALEELQKRRDSIPSRIGKITTERHTRLIEQLPEGIYTKTTEIVALVKSAMKRIGNDSLNYSPLVLNFKEFGCCKVMKYNRGNIITGRDKEIEDILLTLCKRSKRGTILVGEPGVGKSQPISEPVLAETGWKPMGEIQIGDKLFTPNGRLATVLGKFPQGIRKVFELEFSDGRKTRCSEEHLWKVYSKNWKRLGSESRVLELKTIKEIKDNTRERLYIDLPSPRLIPDKNHFIDPYTLGVLIGDGCIVNNARFTNSSDELIERVKIYLQVGYELTISQQRTSKQIDIVRKKDSTGKNEYVSELKRLGLLGKKSYEKFIPEEYINSNYGETIALLSGLLDTDGTVSANGCIQYYTTSKQLALDVQYLARSIGCTAKIKEKKTKYGYNGEMREGKLCHVVSISKQWPKGLFTLQSKKEKLPNYLNRTLRLEISSIKEVEEEECECIYIDDPDHLYITRDFIITHNTAIVNAINAKLIQRTVPRQLVGCQIFNLDIPYVFSRYKEDPFGTIIKVLERASEYDKAILFIDEVHQLLGQKMNDIMKPYLTEKIRFIGSTTLNEFHTIITDDSALERRFTVVHVSEPTIEETVKMVTNTKSVFEDHHKCNIPPESCRYAVENGSRFQGHRRNPDKSLDVLDIACSIMYEKEIKLHRESREESTEFLENIENNASIIKSAKIIAADRTLNSYYINLAISSLTGISYNEIQNSLDYEEVVKRIKEDIVNQDKAVEKVSNVINIFKNTRSDRKRPISIILMIGAPGVGKKSVANHLAKNLFGHDSCFIDYDMSAFGDSFRLSELKGAPPGYVGYGKSGSLIKKIRNMPQSVIYFRGINKAHKDIQQYIMDACRTGKMIDSAEREASLNNAIIIFSVTLNDTQLEEMKKSKRGMGFSKKEEKEEDDSKVLEQVVGSSLLNSVDDVIQFNELKEEDLKTIYERNKDEFLSTYRVDVDLDKLEEAVLDGAKNGHEVMSRLSAEVPKLVFKTLSKKENKHAKKQVSKKNRKDDSHGMDERRKLTPNRHKNQFIEDSKKAEG